MSVQQANKITNYSIKNRIIKDAEDTKKIRSAFENDEFHVYLQPKFNVLTGELVGAEALVRWIDENGDILLPNSFIPTIEKKGLIANLDEQVLRLVCANIKRLIDNKTGHMPVSINFTAHIINDKDFVKKLVKIVDEYDVPHEYIEIELKEYVMLEKQEQIESFIEELHYWDFKIAIDNFGSHSSSIGLLKNLKVDTLKLDRNFFSNNKDVVRGELIVDNIINLAQDLNIFVVAEGVETEEQLGFLKNMECDAAQGFYYTKPLSAKDFDAKFAEFMPKASLVSDGFMSLQPMLSKSENRKFDAVLNILNSIKTPAIMFNAGFRQFKCNSDALKLFKMDSIEDWQIEFFRLSPEFQPDGEFSMMAFFDIIKELEEKSSLRAVWMHCDAFGKEIPCEIFMNKLHLLNDSGEELYIGLINDMRGQLASFEEDETSKSNGFFFNSMTSKTLFNIVTGLSNEWFFTYDINCKVIQFLGSGSEKMNLPKERHVFPSEESLNKIVCEEDLEKFNDFVESMRGGLEKSFELRLKMSDDEIVSYKFLYTIIMNDGGVPLFAVGKASDISEQKELEGKAQRDLLTGCYNKISTESFIQNTIKDFSDQSHALFIIDIDDFKGINDNLGHAVGDQVLKDLSKSLHGYFREKDIVGRIGGDEFVVFLKNIDNVDVLVQKAQSIADAFKSSYAGEKKEHKVSGSVGVALFPTDAKDFEELFAAADKALYKSKMAGKDCYTFYSQDNASKTTALLKNVGRAADVFYDQKLVSRAFELLHEDEDKEILVNRVLEHMGKTINVDRTYIFIASEDNQTYKQKFEWCNENVPSRKELYQNVKKESLKEFLEVLSKTGIFYCNDFGEVKSQGAKEAAEMNDIKSVLLLRATQNKKNDVRFFIGFDDYNSQRVWTEKEVNSIQYVLKMLSIIIFCAN